MSDCKKCLKWEDQYNVLETKASNGIKDYAEKLDRLTKEFQNAEINNSLTIIGFQNQIQTLKQAFRILDESNGFYEDERNLKYKNIRSKK